MVFDDTVDMTTVAAGVANFLAVESCGQCLPCKLDGLELAALLARLGRSELANVEYDRINKRIANVADRARCYLAIQQQVVLSSTRDHFGSELTAHLDRQHGPVEPELIAELIDIHGGQAVWDERHRDKQPDWTYNRIYSGTVPVDRYRSVEPPWAS